MVTLMSFGGFLYQNRPGGGSARIIAESEADIPYSNGTNHNNNNNNTSSNDRMPSGAISQPRLATPTLAKSMFNSPGLSLALVSETHNF